MRGIKKRSLVLLLQSFFFFKLSNLSPTVLQECDAKSVEYPFKMHCNTTAFTFYTLINFAVNTSVLLERNFTCNGVFLLCGVATFTSLQNPNTSSTAVHNLKAASEYNERIKYRTHVE